MTEENNKSRCRWCNLANPLYVRYHDEEWGVPCHDDHALYELLILESFQAGLSWETVLNKRARFREVYDGFDLDKVCAYGEEKIARLLSDEGIIRNRLKIRASVKNSRIFRDIQEEYGTLVLVNHAEMVGSTKMTPPLPPARCPTPFPKT